jgi:hypothetical protein
MSRPEGGQGDIASRRSQREKGKEMAKPRELVIIHNMVEELLSQFRPYRGLTGPAPSPVRLWSDGGRGAWIDDDWGRQLNDGR